MSAICQPGHSVNIDLGYTTYLGLGDQVIASARGISPAFCTFCLRAKFVLASHPGLTSTDFMEHTPGVCQHCWILVDTHPFLSVFSFNQCSYFLHQFEENTIIRLLYSKHNILTQLWLSPGPVCCTDPQLWIAQGLSKALQLFLSRLMLSFINEVKSHHLQCCKCLTNRNGDKHMLKSFAKLVSQRGRGLRLVFIDCMWF